MDKTNIPFMNPKLYCFKHYIFWKIYRTPAMDWQEINRGMYDKLFISNIIPLVSIAKISRKSLYELTDVLISSTSTIPAFKMRLNNKIYNELFYNLFP